ncbi:GDSL-type esterase/lipase family protein [Gracilibacillus sp. S3-1-1]|uniref:GDSL-type esterase/lipase family protein n=1 Tax=Gracilibacillus pellucidus TaxID=3095368 RepID=A0ACC6M275_9BACI|nr:GDSL-type esterase/lipase family protein [Gracilibacillus sp. S3-1-1]MDX8045058.1 GDSL-type esterase/lipase family protein [Gracilibacillus sp. S3-1-1]
MDKFTRKMVLMFVLVVIPGIVLSSWTVAAANKTLTFDFGTGSSNDEEGYYQVTPTTEYSTEQGYGFTNTEGITAYQFEREDLLQKDALRFNDETIFKVDLEPGDYQLTFIAGDADEEISVGVKVEDIQKVENQVVESNQFLDETFELALIEETLSLQLTGENPRINGLRIERLAERNATKHPTVYVASDSTAQTYDDYWKPQTGWGQVLDRYFKDRVTVDNHAIGGRSSKTFYTEGRLDTILREIKPDDYLLIQFGHNDATYTRPERYTTVEDFKDYLTTYVTGVRQRGAVPILITPVNRRDFNPDTGIFNVSFPEYKEGMEEVAAELDVLLVDLNSLSRELFNELGPEGTKSIFLHLDPGMYEAHPNGVADDTHFQEHGAIQVARILSEGIKKLNTPLARYVQKEKRGKGPFENPREDNPGKNK